MALDLQKMHTARANIERIAEGTYMSRFSAVIDLGVQPQTDWKSGEATDSKPRVLLTWELPTETIEVNHEDGSQEFLPRLISKEYTSSNYDQSNLMKLIKVMKQGLGNLGELLDVECMVSIGSTVTGNAKVVNCVPVPQGMEVDQLSKPTVSFDFDDPNEEVFKSLPRWIRTKITDAENYTGFADGWVQEEEAA